MAAQGPPLPFHYALHQEADATATSQQPDQVNPPRYVQTFIGSQSGFFPAGTMVPGARPCPGCPGLIAPAGPTAIPVPGMAQQQAHQVYMAPSNTNHLIQAYPGIPQQPAQYVRAMYTPTSANAMQPVFIQPCGPPPSESFVPGMQVAANYVAQYDIVPAQMPQAAYQVIYPAQAPNYARE